MKPQIHRSRSPFQHQSDRHAQFPDIFLVLLFLLVAAMKPQVHWSRSPPQRWRGCCRLSSDVLSSLTPNELWRGLCYSVGTDQRGRYCRCSSPSSDWSRPLHYLSLCLPWEHAIAGHRSSPLVASAIPYVGLQTVANLTCVWPRQREPRAQGDFGSSYERVRPSMVVCACALQLGI